MTEIVLCPVCNIPIDTSLSFSVPLHMNNAHYDFWHCTELFNVSDVLLLNSERIQSLYAEYLIRKATGGMQ